MVQPQKSLHVQRQLRPGTELVSSGERLNLDPTTRIILLQLPEQRMHCLGRHPYCLHQLINRHWTSADQQNALGGALQLVEVDAVRLRDQTIGNRHVLASAIRMGANICGWCARTRRFLISASNARDDPMTCNFVAAAAHKPLTGTPWGGRPASGSAGVCGLGTSRRDFISIIAASIHKTSVASSRSTLCSVPARYASAMCANGISRRSTWPCCASVRSWSRGPSNCGIFTMYGISGASAQNKNPLPVACATSHRIGPIST